MKKLLLILTAIFLVGVIVLYLYLSKRLEKSFTPTVIKVEIKSETLNESMYLKKKAWGITDDQAIIVLSKSPAIKFEPNPQEEYIYEGLPELFYKVQQDTLYIYTSMKSVIPVNVNTKFVIVQKELENAGIAELYRTYTNKNIKKL